MSAAGAVMPFGKHAGTPLAELPAPYVDWLSKQELRDPLKSSLAAELKRRGTARTEDTEPLDEKLRGDEERVVGSRCPHCGKALSLFVTVTK